MRVYHSSSVRVEHPDLHDAGYHAILEAKYARIIEEISNMYSISLDEAMDMFYHSDTMQLMEEVLPTCIAVVTSILPRKCGESGIHKKYDE